MNAAYTITQPDLLTAAVNPINVTACNGNANASIEITGSTGGSSFYEYTINGGTIWQSGNLFTGLVAGTYNVKMRDANAPTCVVTLNGALTLTQPTALNATLSSTNLICYNTPEGEISITVPTGGSGSYEYSHNGGTSWQGTGTFSNLSAGYYNVVFRDAVNTSCTLTLNNALQLTQPNILNATINTTDVSVCYGNNNGAISLTIPTGGSGNYEYSINGGAGWQASDVFNTLTTGTYDIYIRDANATSCSIQLNSALFISEPVELSAILNKTNASCNGTSDGSISISSPSGGSGAYEYTINGGTSWEGTGSYTLLSASTYDVRIRDANNIGCVITLNAAYTINEPTALTAYITTTEISCHDSSDGTASIVVNGGTPTYNYLWSDADSQTTATCFNLSFGVYFCTVTDNNGCTIIISGSIVNPPQFNITIALAQALKCSYDTDAILTITEINGMSPYQYIWDDSFYQTTQSADSLPSGAYSVSVTDSKGCFTTNTFTIVPPVDSVVSITPLTTYTFSSDDTTSVQLIGNPAGGIFSGAGVMQYNNTFRPNIAGVGNWPITYTYTHPTGCIISFTDTVHVINVLGQITGITDTVFYCFGDTNIHIWGIPSPNVNDTGWFVNTAYVQDLGNKHGVFNPTLAGPGTHTITFKYIYNAAILEILMNVKVDSVGVPDLIGLDTAYCYSNASITANAINQFPPNGSGIWSGLGFNTENTFNATFNINTVGIGQDTVFYEYTAPSNCKKMVSFPIIVHPLPTDSFVSLDEICRNASPFELHGNNPNVITDYIKINTIAYNNDTVIVNPSAINIGDNIITYQYHNPITGCVNNWEDTLFVHQIPTLSIQGNEQKYCTNSPIDTLIGIYSYNAIPYNGGLFSGVGIFSTGDGAGIINPSTPAIENLLDSATRQYNDTIFLVYTDTNGCTVNTFSPIKIYGLPDITIEGINPEHSLCINSPSSLLSYSMSPYLSGTSFWKIMNFQTNNLQPSSFIDTLNNTPSQSYIDVPVQLVFNASNSQCITTVNDTVVIHKLPDVDFTITSDKCISNPIVFEGISTIDSVSIWQWDMGDETIIPNDSIAQHIYTSGGNKSIELTLTSKFGCVNSKNSVVYFDSIPTAQFTWKNECFGGFVAFINNSFGDTIDSYYWTFGDNQSSTLQNPTHEYSQTGAYDITLVITTKNSCIDSITQTALIRPEIVQYPYFENFDVSSGAWSSGSSNNKDSWCYGQALSSNLPPPYSGTSAWYTSYKLDSAYQNEEQSYVISPCFNFSDLKRPMIKMRIFCATEKYYDGAALQYSLDNDSTWYTLKDVNEIQEGISWYDNVVNYSYPGGGNFGWSDSIYNQWTDARHDLDILAGEPSVRLRIAFASNNSNIYNGFAFDDIWIGERPRMVLFEHFTNANDVSSATGNVKFNDWVNQNQKDIVDIQYHTEYPVADQLNLDYPQGSGAQSFMYGVSVVPYTIMDGNYLRSYISPLTLYPYDVFLTKLRHRRLTDPKFTVDIDLGFTGSSINVLTEITALENITDKDLTVHVVVVEKFMDRTGVGTNGETKFLNTVRKMLPDAAGTNISENWSTGDVRTLQYSSSLANFYSAIDSNVIVVVYVQDNLTKEVYQVSTTDTSQGTFIAPIEAYNNNIDFIIAPNPASTNMNLYFNRITDAPYTIQVYNILGQLIEEKTMSAFSEVYTLNVANYSPGFYHVKLNVEENKHIIKKFIIGR